MKSKPLEARQRRTLKDYGLDGADPEQCRSLSFEPGETVLSEGEALMWLLIVTEGIAKVCRTAPNGKSLILSRYASEGLIGEVELVADERRAASSVRAVGPFECMAVPAAFCREQLASNAVFLSRLCAELAGKLQRDTATSAELALCTGEQRLCRYILGAAYQGMFRDTISDVACSVGLSYRHSFRLLGELCQAGVLEKRESGYAILSVPKLRRLASTLPSG